MNGISDNIPVEYVIKLFAESNNKFSAGAINTGVPPSIVAQFLKNKTVEFTGVLPPEAIIPAKVFFNELARRNLKIELLSKSNLN